MKLDVVVTTAASTLLFLLNPDLQSYGYILSNYLPDRKACCDFVGTLGSSFSLTSVRCPAACFRFALPPTVTTGRLGKDVIASEPHFCKNWSNSQH